MKSLVTSLLPRGVTSRIVSLRNRPVAHPGRADEAGAHRCPVCRSGVAAFDPLPPSYAQQMLAYGFPYAPNDFETLNVDQYSCPVCGASDRERLYALYADSALESGPERQLRVLDFIPSAALDRHFREDAHLDYRTADLLEQDVDFRSVDVTDLVFRNELFDFIICSHVLEHVHDADLAMRELHRVLRPGGQCIAMVPIVIGLTETLEDSTHTAAADRWKHYGQDDHVRLFAREDFVDRLTKAKFEVRVLGVDDFDRDRFYRHGISMSSRLYIASKPSDGG